jgi:hypothetical protein
MTGDDASIISAVDAAEDHMKEIYQKVVLDKELSDPTRGPPQVWGCEGQSGIFASVV